MKSRLKVVLGTSYPNDESRVRTGVEAVGLHLVRALAERSDVELHVVTCNSAVRRDRVEQRGNATFHWLATARRLYGLRAVTVDSWRVRRVYDRLRPDVIHSNGCFEYAIACRPEGKLALVVHGVEGLSEWAGTDRHYAGVVGAYRLLISRELIRWSVKKAGYVISIAGEYIPTMLRPFLTHQRVAYIANPIEEGFFLPWTEPPSDRPTVLCIGTIMPLKRTIDLIIAFEHVVRQLPQARLQLLGGVGEREYYQAVQEQIDKRHLRANVTHDLDFTQSVLKEALTACSVVALCSAQETAPMAISVAMATGRPVVATRVGGVPWMVTDGHTGYLVDVGDVGAIAARLVELLKDRPRSIQFGLRGRQDAEERFRGAHVAEKTIQVYRELCGDSKPQSDR
jgi:glycosyltransferase involved in cell wall biosynthesis